jgi:hypothetical protein
MCARDGECIESCKVTPLTDYIYTQSKELESVRSAVDEICIRCYKNLDNTDGVCKRIKCSILNIRMIKWD